MKPLFVVLVLGACGGATSTTEPAETTQVADTETTTTTSTQTTTTEPSTTSSVTDPDIVFEAILVEMGAGSGFTYVDLPKARDLALAMCSNWDNPDFDITDQLEGVYVLDSPESIDAIEEGFAALFALPVAAVTAYCPEYTDDLQELLDEMAESG